MHNGLKIQVFFFCFPRCVYQLGAVVRGAIRWRTEEEEEEEEGEKAAGNTLSCTTGKCKKAEIFGFSTPMYTCTCLYFD